MALMKSSDFEKGEEGKTMKELRKGNHEVHQKM